MTIPRNLSFLAEGASSTGVLGTAKGGTNLSSFTVNGILYASSNSVLNTSSNLQFDGSNLGVGATPSGWGASAKVYELPNGTFFLNYASSSQAIVGANAYYTGSNWIYKNSSAASNYEQNTGSHKWFTSSSGSAGGVITFTQVMQTFPSGGVSIGNTTDPGASNLSVSGNANIGGTSATEKLDINGGVIVRGSVNETSGNAGLYLSSDASTTATLEAINPGNAYLTLIFSAGTQTFKTNGTERARIYASGGVSIGNTTDPGSKNLSVSGTVLTGGYTVATLPTGVTGARAYVTNALAPTYGSTVVGGGSVTIPVFYNGTNWIVA